MNHLELTLKNFDTKDVIITFMMATLVMAFSTFAMSVATFIMVLNHTNLYQPQIVAEAEAQAEAEAEAEAEAQAEAEAEVQAEIEEDAEEDDDDENDNDDDEAEAEAEAEAEPEEEPAVQAPAIKRYSAAVDADQLIIREHRKKHRAGMTQITAIVRFLQENPLSAKEEVCDAMENLGENYTGGSTQPIRRTVSKWLNDHALHKGCICTN